MMKELSEWCFITINTMLLVQGVMVHKGILWDKNQEY